MGMRNVLVEGVSGSGKSSVAAELRRRGYEVVDGDRELAYCGDPVSGQPVAADASWTGPDVHAHHIWNVARVRALAADRSAPVTYFCGGSRNVPAFLDLFDDVVVLSLDRATLVTRLDGMPPDRFGGRPDERALILRLHATEEDLPAATLRVDATAPLDRVVDAIERGTAPRAPAA